VRNFALLAAITFVVSSCRSTTTPADSGSGDDSPSPIVNRRMFPADNPWNKDISAEAVDPASDVLIATCGANAQLHPDFGTTWNGGPIGIPYVVISGNQAKVPVSFDYADESDPGPYPIPSDAPVEGGSSSDGDRHVLVLDSDMRDLSGLEVARTLREDSGRVGIVLYTLDSDACVEARAIGIDACVTKDSAPSMLIAAIRSAAQAVSAPPVQ
jgi:CheY-like chemotaxis protein